MRISETATAVTRQRQLGPASSAPRRGSEYAQLSRQIKEAGLLERRGGVLRLEDRGHAGSDAAPTAVAACGPGILTRDQRPWPAPAAPPAPGIPSPAALTYWLAL
jgi:hypothetical protein